jgi:hypothetical protein
MKRHFKMRTLPSLCRFQIDGMKVESAAKHIIAAGDNHRFCAALALLDLIERKMNRANDCNINCIAACRALQRQGCNSIGYGERQRIHASALLSSPKQLGLTSMAYLVKRLP